MSQQQVEFDEIGYWSEVKLDILREYATAYSTILSKKNLPHIYVDAFAGAGLHVSRTTGKLVSGSPVIALEIQPSFREYHFIDLDSARVQQLKRLSTGRANVQIYEGNCNAVLRNRIFPTLQYETRRRALCLLDPYGLDLDWEVIFTAGQLRTVDMFLNFPVMGMNRTALWRRAERVSEKALKRMNAYWGDDSWRNVAYEKNLFGEPSKENNEALIEGFRNRLISVAGFKRVPEPIPMRNRNNAVVYYLFFASQFGVAEKIVLDIFRKYKNRRGL